MHATWSMALETRRFTASHRSPLVPCTACAFVRMSSASTDVGYSTSPESLCASPKRGFVTCITMSISSSAPFRIRMFPAPTIFWYDQPLPSALAFRAVSEPAGVLSGVLWSICSGEKRRCPIWR
eukprot:53923-Rhodomonas_salina.1